MSNSNRFLVGRVALVIWASGFILVLSGCAPTPWFAPIVDAHYQGCQRTETEVVCRQRAYREWESYAAPAPVWIADEGLYGVLTPGRYGPTWAPGGVSDAPPLFQDHPYRPGEPIR